jgi:hypothetical protein
MEEIEASAATEEKPVDVGDSTEDVVTTTEQSKEMVEARTVIADDVTPVLEAQKSIVEVVIVTKSEEPVKEPVEEPILPDHYYDDGNVPVFKPVCSWQVTGLLTS